MILILGGTAEARELAGVLVEAGHDVVTSLAGRVREPARPAGRVRVGSFGGVAGLADYLRTSGVTVIVDATHPFAAQISGNTAAAAEQTGTPVIRLERPGWADHPRAGSWAWVRNADDARSAGEHSTRPFLTTGRQSLETFLPWSDRTVLARVVELPAFPPPESWTLLTSRGPYSYADEHQLMVTHQIDLLITKDSGGRHTAAKLDAAADLGVEVVIIARPAREADSVVTTVAEARAWCDVVISGRAGRPPARTRDRSGPPL